MHPECDLPGHFFSLTFRKQERPCNSYSRSTRPFLEPDVAETTIDALPPGQPPPLISVDRIIRFSDVSAFTIGKNIAKGDARAAGVRLVADPPGALFEEGILFPMKSSITDFWVFVGLKE